MRVTGVETEKGTIKCQYFVNAAGIWAHEIGRMSEPPVKIPIWPAERFFMTFENIEELEGKSLPNVRDYDSQVYIRQNGSSFMMGAFESQARPYDLKRLGKDVHWSKITDQQGCLTENYQQTGSTLVKTMNMSLIHSVHVLCCIVI